MTLGVSVLRDGQDKLKMRNSHRLEETNNNNNSSSSNKQLNEMLDPGLNPGREKNNTGQRLECLEQGLPFS